MKVLITTREEKFVVELTEFETMTRQQQFQQFMNHFRTSGWFQISDDVAIAFNSVKRFEIVNVEEQNV